MTFVCNLSQLNIIPEVDVCITVMEFDELTE